MRAVIGCIVLTLCGASLPALAQAAVTHYELNIPREPLDQALKEFARQTGLQVARFSEVTRNSGVAGPIVGSYTTVEALNSLLAGSKLSYRVLTDRTIAIVSQQDASQPMGEQSRKGDEKVPGSFWERFRLAQMDRGTPASTASVEEKSQQDSAEESARLEEVIVTAQKREERLLDVPISLAVVGGEELQARHVVSIDDLPLIVPDLAINSDGATRTIEIRGVSNFSGGTTALVGMYLDEADVTLAKIGAINPSVYDLERVEVLRGPQGTLYGEGSAGGTVRFITNNPDLNSFAMKADVSALFTENGAPGQRVNAMVNVPVVANELGLRLAGTFNREGGWIDQPLADQKDINGEDLTSVRLKGLWRPMPQFTVSALAQLNRDDRSTGVGDDAAGNFAQVFNLSVIPTVEQRQDLYNLTLNYDFPVLRVLSTTTYLKAVFDARNYGNPQPLAPPPAKPLDYYISSSTSNNLAIIEELRLSSPGSGPWQWTAGAFLKRYRNYGGLGPTYFGDRDQPLPEPFGASWGDTLYKSTSVFADVSYQPVDGLVIGVGGRYFHDKQENTATDLALNLVNSQTGRFHSVDPRAYVRYKPTEQISIYASAAKGFRSGGFNNFGQPNFDPEEVWSYELGTKMALLQGRLRLDAAVFTTNYSDYQTAGFAATAAEFLTENAGKAKIKGFDADVTWQPLDLWTLGVNGSYVHTRFTSINLESAGHQVGDPLDFVPKYQFTLSAQRELLLLNDKSAAIRLYYSQQGPEVFRDRIVGPFFFGQSDTIRLLNLSIRLRWSQNLALSFFAQNLLNNRGATTPIAFVGGATRSRPRTYGVEFNVDLH